MPSFSIVIPTYNHGHCIERCLRSVINQTFTNWEAIIINNYSIDNTIEVINNLSDPRIKLINFKNNGVISASRNVGILASKADWIAFLDSDDWWYPNKLEIVSKYLKEADILYHDLHIFNHQGKKLRRIKSRRLKKPVFIDLLTLGNRIATSSVIVKKDILINVNLFDEDNQLIAVEDFDTWLKIARETDNFYYIEKTLGAYWIGSGNTTQATEEQFKRIEFVYKKYLNLLSPKDKYEVEAIMSYSLGAIQWKRNLSNEAINLFKVSTKSHIIEIKIKSYYYILLNILCNYLIRKTEYY